MATTLTETLPEAAQLVHQSPGRLRLRLPQLRGAGAELDALQAAVEALPGVLTVKVNAVVGSLLLEHQRDDAEMIDALSQAGLALAQETFPRGTPKPALRAGVELPLGPKQLAATALAIMGIVQLARGNIASPATTAFWYAYSLLEQGEAPD